MISMVFSHICVCLPWCLHIKKMCSMPWWPGVKPRRASPVKPGHGGGVFVAGSVVAPGDRETEPSKAVVMAWSGNPWGKPMVLQPVLEVYGS